MIVGCWMWEVKYNCEMNLFEEESREKNIELKPL